MRFWSAAAGILLLGGFVQAAAQDLEKQAAALKVIRETAAEICCTIELKGKRTETQLKGELEAKVNGAAAKVVGLGVSGGGELKTEDYQGLTRDALAAALKSSTECRLNVLNSLIGKMLPVAAPAQPRGDAAEPSVQTLPAALPSLPKPSLPVRPSYYAGQIIRDCPECPELVVVPQGELLMGGSSPRAFDSNTDPQHPVRIAAFAVARFEVTRREFAAFARATKYQVDDSCTPSLGQGEGGRTWEHPGFDQTDDHPAVCISWINAQAYIAWLKFRTRQNYRLLSEAEWEYAAKGGTRPQYFGVDYRTICAQANVADNDFSSYVLAKNRGAMLPRQYAGCRDGYVQTAPVGRLAPNRFGLYDMQGNVWEWVEDCYRESYAGAPADQTPVEDLNCRYRVVRGGSWASVPSDAALERRTAKTPTSHFDDVGFRIARSL